MHFIKALSTALLATAATASPLASSNNVLSRRADSQGQAGGYIEVGDNVKLTTIKGTVKMPDISGAAERSKVSYWIGIDGINTDGAGDFHKHIVIQAGFDAEKEPGGAITYKAFYEWFPNDPKYVTTNDFSAKVGDEVAITIKITAYGTTAQATFVNQSTGKTYTSPEFITPGEDYDAKGVNAAWVMEYTPEAALAKFSDIIFTGCSASNDAGQQSNLNGGTTLNLVRNGQRLAAGTIVGSDGVRIAYTGP